MSWLPGCVRRARALRRREGAGVLLLLGVVAGAVVFCAVTVTLLVAGVLAVLFDHGTK